VAEITRWRNKTEKQFDVCRDDLVSRSASILDDQQRAVLIELDGTITAARRWSSNEQLSRTGRRSVETRTWTYYAR